MKKFTWKDNDEHDPEGMRASRSRGGSKTTNMARWNKAMGYKGGAKGKTRFSNITPEDPRKER